MNLARLLSGCVKALGRREDWPDDFDLSRTGLKHSFIALLLSLPCYYVCGVSIMAERAVRLDTETVTAIPTAPFLVILLMYLLTFIVGAYILTMVFDRQDRFRPWVILRHWSVFFLTFFAAIAFGLALVDAVPFMVAAYLALGLYLGQLVIDIRLAQKIVGFEWGAAVFTGCIITALGMTVLLIGAAQYSA